MLYNTYVYKICITRLSKLIIVWFTNHNILTNTLLNTKIRNYCLYFSIQTICNLLLISKMCFTLIGTIVLLCIKYIGNNS